MPRALNGSRSIRSIFPESAKPPRSSPRRSSAAERSEPKETSKRRGASGRGGPAPAPGQRPRGRPTACPRPPGEAPVHVPRESLVETLSQEDERVVDSLGLDTVAAEPPGEPRVEAEERLMSDLAPQARVDLALDRARIDQALDQPERRALGEGLE